MIRTSRPLLAGSRSFAGLSLDRVRIMGVINVTPDSFSDGGETFTTEAAVARGRQHLAAGADIVDVGGESTRPGADPVSIEEELRRVIPVVRALAAEGALISIDTRHAEVMSEAIAAGARIVNDVSGLTGDASAVGIIEKTGSAAVLMHMQGDPQTMQCAPHYGDAAVEICDWLGERIAVCEAAGIGRDRLAADPGIGFGKTVEHNLDILARLGLYQRLGVAIAIGVSRKSFIAKLSRNEAPASRLPGSLAAMLAAVGQGAQIVRVHDVAATRQALAVWEAIARHQGDSAAARRGPDPATLEK